MRNPDPLLTEIGLGWTRGPVADDARPDRDMERTMVDFERLRRYRPSRVKMLLGKLHLGAVPRTIDSWSGA